MDDVLLVFTMGNDHLSVQKEEIKDLETAIRRLFKKAGVTSPFLVVRHPVSMAALPIKKSLFPIQEKKDE